jgi:hypothetical protein
MTALSMSITFFIGDGVEGTKFSSYTIETKGVGNSDTKAYLSAFKNIRVNDPGYAQFLETGKKKIIEYAYMSASSDPGWMVGLSEKTIQNIDSCSQSLRSQFDLDITTFPLAREHMVSSYLRQFTSSFAANRSISVYANQAYSTIKLLESTQQFLYQEDEPSAAGYQLPGGIHLLLKSVEELPEVEWRNPPICFYEPNNLGQHEWKYSKDIDLLPPIGDLKFHSISSERINMPR